MKRHLILPLTAAALALTGGTASAHIPTVSDSCQGLNVALTNYEGGGSNNQVVVTIDGGSQTFTFGGSFTRTFTWSTSSAHAWTVVIDANRNNGHPTQYDKTFNGTEQPCTTTTTSVSTTTTTTQPSTTTTPTPTTTSTTPTISSPSTTTLPETTSTVEVGEPPVPSSIPPTPPSIQPTTPPASVADPILPVTGPDGTARLLIVACALVAAGILLAHTARRP